MGVEVDKGGYLSQPATEQAKIETVVNAAIELGVYVIVDWHVNTDNMYVDNATLFFSGLAQTYAQYPNLLYEPYFEPNNGASGYI